MDNQTTHDGFDVNMKHAGKAEDDMSASQKSSEDIKNEIRQTKDEMVETASELGKRMRPSHVISQYAEKSGMIQFCKKHPVSLSLFAIGTAIYLAEKKKPALGIDPYAIKERMSHTAESLTEKAHDAKERLSHSGETIRSYAQRGYETSQEFFNSSPLMVGAIALMAGAAVGFGLPISERERRMMQKPAQMVDKAKEALVEKSKHVVDDVKSYASQNLGLQV